MTRARGASTTALDGEAVAADLLREIALHRETAALLDMRARRADTPVERALLARRAAQRRMLAQRLHEQLTGGPDRHPSAHH